MNTFVRGLLQLIPRNLVKPVVSCIRVINSCRIHERLNGSEALVIHISSQGGSISPEGVANEDASASRIQGARYTLRICNHLTH